MRLFLMVVTVVMLGFLVACGQETPPPPPTGHPLPIFLEFSTVEEFLYAHRAVAEGRVTGELMRLAEDVDFVSLRELPLLTNLPEEYELTGIWV